MPKKHHPLRTNILKNWISLAQTMNSDITCLHVMHLSWWNEKLRIFFPPKQRFAREKVDKSEWCPFNGKQPSLLIHTCIYVTFRRNQIQLIFYFLRRRSSCAYREESIISINRNTGYIQEQQKILIIVY